MSEEKNYHSLLLGLSRVFDDVIEEMKDSYIDEKYSNWFLWLIGSPFRDLKRLGEVKKGIEQSIDSGKLLSLFPFLSGGISPYLIGFYQELSPFQSMLVGITAGYLITLPFYFHKLLTFKSGHFHLGAYRKFRRQEYNLFKSALLDDKRDFFFQGLYDYVGVMKSGNKEFQQFYTMIEERLERYLDREKRQLETKVSVLKSQLKRQEKEYDTLIGEYETFIDGVAEEIREFEEGVEFIIDLIKDINTVLFRMKNGLFSTKDLNLVSGFTLYKLKGAELIKLEDVGTTGSTPDKLPLKSDRKWGAIEAVTNNDDKPVINTPYKNRTVVSYRLRMGINNNEVWIFNFHFDTDDKKAKHLLVNDDIIESREIYRLIHALCLLSQENFTNKKEAAE
ncbi:hypothetical protein NC797_06965 [Aquibacillus sp. 3ASR75-11]|uniref:Uncharacterized protein n=1 Tax=Terrihalobacillus insolitus TaxID=2950438 RepID=A0A9X3WTA1_9BACI|nr:hypothetical protein [Terrihalobacillus insolitus]MDC3424248.1 hypothetical protein [Terrihalobacillus insolitus]